MRQLPTRRSLLLAGLGGVVGAAGAACAARMPPAEGGGGADHTDLEVLMAGVTSGTVRLPRGTHRLTSPIAVPPGVRLQGEGPETILLVGGEGLTSAVVLGAGAAVSDLTIQGTGARSDDRDAIATTAASAGLVVERVRVRAWHGNAVHFDASTGARIEELDVDGVTCTASEKQGSAVLLTSIAGHTRDPVVSRVVARRCAGSAVQLEGDYDRSDWRTAGYKVHGARVSGCRTSENVWAGVFLNSCFDSVVTDCRADGNGDYGVGLEFCNRSRIEGCATRDNGTFGQALFETNQSCSIVDGTAEANAEHGFVHIQGQAVSAAPADDCAILRVRSARNAGCGIYARDVTRTRISGEVTENGEHGVSIYGGSGYEVEVTSRGNLGDRVAVERATGVTVVEV